MMAARKAENPSQLEQLKTGFPRFSWIYCRSIRTGGARKLCLKSARKATLPRRPAAVKVASGHNPGKKLHAGARKA